MGDPQRNFRRRTGRPATRTFLGAAAAGVIGASALIPAAAYAAPSDTVQMDYALQKCIRMQLGGSFADPITEAEMESLNRLECLEGDDPVMSLEGIQYATNLTSLSTSLQSMSRLDSIEPAAALPKLAELNVTVSDTFDSAQVIDFPDTVKTLRVTTHSAGPFSLDFLGGFDGLTFLELDAVNGGVKDLAAISDVPTLRDVIIRSSEVSAVPDMSALPHINTFLLDGFADDISNVATAPGLKALQLGRSGPGEPRVSDSPIDLSALSGLSSLTNLTLSGYPNESLDGLEALTNLNRLSVFRFGSLKDIDAAAGMDSLTHVRFVDTSLSSAGGFSNRTDLEQFYLSVSELTDLTGMGDLIASTDDIVLSNQWVDLTIRYGERIPNPIVNADGTPGVPVFDDNGDGLYYDAATNEIVLDVDATVNTTYQGKQFSFRPDGDPTMFSVVLNVTTSDAPIEPEPEPEPGTEPGTGPEPVDDSDTGNDNSQTTPPVNPGEATSEVSGAVQAASTGSGVILTLGVAVAATLLAGASVIAGQMALRRSRSVR